MEEAIGGDNADVAFSAFGRPASVSVRFNPEKLGERTPSVAEAAEALFCCGAVVVPWSRTGFLLERRPEFTLDPWLHAGGYYVQDSSAMFVGEMFRRVVCETGESFGAAGTAETAGLVGGGTAKAAGARVVRVLDLCAAPGGKTTDLAGSLRTMFGENFLLVANEVMKDRVNVLSENVARWGDPNVMVTCADPAAFAALEGFFDVIVADVPCSGEGMFRKDAGAVDQWSPDNVALCRSRQRRILADVWPALAEGGAMVYSTCTFNRMENDDNVLWMCENLGGEVLRPGNPWSFGREELRSGMEDDADAAWSATEWRLLKTQCGVSLVPGFVPGEGQYCAAVRKTGGSAAEPWAERCAAGPASERTSVRTAETGGGRRSKRGGESAGSRKSAADTGRFKEYFSVEVEVRRNGETVIAMPQNIVPEVDTVGTVARTVRTGCTVGTMKGADLVPSTDLALCTALKEGAFETAEVPLETALKFLHRDAIVLPDAPKGYIILKYNGLPMGFVKNLGNRCNNLYPQGRRIRMDV